MVGQRVGAACSPDKVGSSRSRPRRGAGVPVRWGAGFTKDSVGRRPPCYRYNALTEMERRDGEESIANLTTIFNADIEMLTAEGLFLSKITSTGRKRMRQSKLGWNYMADTWETMSRYKNMADKEGLKIGQVKSREEQKVKDRKKSNRDTQNRKILAEEQIRETKSDTTSRQAITLRGVAGIGEIIHIFGHGQKDSASRLLS